MKNLAYVALGWALIFASATLAQTATELEGLWEARMRFGPDVRGTLVIRQTDGAWRAEISGLSTAAIVGNEVRFELPGGNGRFVGKFTPKRDAIEGHWFQAPARFTSGMAYASPVRLVRVGAEYRGEVVPTEEALTFYLHVKQRSDGTVGAFLRNHERNLGRFIRVDRLERDGDLVKLLGAPTATDKGRLWAEGRLASDVLTVSIPSRGGSYDFRRVDPSRFTDFYSRGRPGAEYTYEKPPQLDDGWPTATLEEVGISRAAIEKFIQGIINAPVDTLASQQDHGILIVRHGKLVLEEYFHGEHREKAHDTRSASKSIASDMVGAAQHAGIVIGPSTPVYSTMNVEPDDPRKRAITLEHILTMSLGLECDDNDDKSPGYEDNMWAQTDQPDFYKWTMALKAVREPGEKSVYCSASSNLVGGVIAKVAKRSGQELFHELLAKPLEIKRYYLTTGPLGELTLTGGSKFFPRDFMKLAQVHLNGGTWKGRRIYSAEWSRRATTPRYELPNYKLKYGYLWWIKDYPHKGRQVTAYFASGNGGQIAMAIPELDLVLGFWAGNYNDVGGRTATNIYVPEHILPAIIK